MWIGTVRWLLPVPGWVTTRVRRSNKLATHTRVCLPTVTTPYQPQFKTPTTYNGLVTMLKFKKKNNNNKQE